MGTLYGENTDVKRAAGGKMCIPLPAALRRAQDGNSRRPGAQRCAGGSLASPSLREPPHPFGPPATPRDRVGGPAVRPPPPDAPIPCPCRWRCSLCLQVGSAEGGVSHLLLEPGRPRVLIGLAGSFGEAPLQVSFLVHAPTFPSPPGPLPPSLRSGGLASGTAYRRGWARVQSPLPLLP